MGEVKGVHRNLPWFKVNLELIHVWCDVCAVDSRGEGCLLHAKHGCSECGDAAGLEDSTSLESFPCGGYFDTCSLWVDCRS